MTRKQRRRAEKTAERMGMDLEQYEAWTSTELPEDHPNPGGEPLLSSLQEGWAAIRTVERSKTLSHLEPKMKGRRGPKVLFPWKALLVCIQLAGSLSSKSYRRSDVTTVLHGLHPVVKEELGLIDDKGNPKVIAHKLVNKMHKRLERLLRLGWNSGSVRCNMAWFIQGMIKASVPRKIRRSVTAVAVDSTSVPAWARTRCYGKQADLNKDAYARHRKAILNNPNLPEPELKRRKLAAAAKEMGLEVGEDGRIIRGKDRDMRVGWATGTAKTKGHYFVGYELTVVVAVRSISWRGNPCRAKRGSAIPPYILAMSFNPAGTNPGPIGFEAVSKALEIAPNINEVIADRAYTVKREDFVRPLHRRGINVVMDYPKTMVRQPKGTTLGKRCQNVMMHCGTILLHGIPKNKETPPQSLLRKGREQDLEKWYNERARLYRWSSKGPTAGGGRRFQSPVRAGRVAASHGPPPKSYSMPKMGTSITGTVGNLRVVNARVAELDTYQQHPWGTTVWRISYGRRSVVEGVFARLKANKGLGGEACKAFGLTANTLAALNAVVAYNRKRTRVSKLRRRRARALAAEHSADSSAAKSSASVRQPSDSPAGGGASPANADPALRAPP